MNRIKEVLKEKKIMAGYLAEKIGKHPSTVSRYLQNEYQPDRLVMKEIARVLKVRVDELIQKSTN